MNEVLLLGNIVRLQIQISSLKIDGEPGRYFTTEPIRRATALEIDEGTITANVDGRRTLDVHSARHPDSRNRGNGNMLSVLFTGHYSLLRERFGSHVVDGVAGENILVECPERVTLENIERGLMIERKTGERIHLDTVAVAHPCTEFSRYCLDDLNADPGEVSRTLKFLDNGTRGYYGIVTSRLPARIEIGDRLLARV